ncbi:hypothetical protein BLA29_005338, partial [Euroglyphus maynei]
EVKKSTKRVPAPPPPVSTVPATSTNGNDSDHAALEALQESIEEADEENEQENESKDQPDVPDEVQDNVRSSSPFVTTIDSSSSSNEQKSVDQNEIALFTDDNNPILNCDPEDISNCDDLTPCHTPQMNESVFDDDNCQVTILSNHSTIINTTGQQTPEDHRNISIVTIDDGKSISIQTSDDKQDQTANDAYALVDKSSKGRINKQHKQSPPSPSQPSSAKNDVTNSNVKTTIKVNLNLKSENERRNANSPKRVPVDNNQQLTTRIDQVTPMVSNRNNGNHERNNHHHHHHHHHKMVQSPTTESNNKSLKRESSNSSSSNFGSVGSSDKENAINSVNKSQQHANDQSSAAILLRKKQRDMVCSSYSFQPSP